MKRAGFTMIELIFVIVILGILSAVAVPKMMNTSSQAKASNCKSYFATLNQTVGPSLWSNMAIDGATAEDTFTADNLDAQLAMPTDCRKTGVEEKDSTSADAAKVAVDATAYTVTIDTAVYDVNGTAGTTTLAPTWTWTKQ